jgi:hypothetical protein
MKPSHNSATDRALTSCHSADTNSGSGKGNLLCLLRTGPWFSPVPGVVEWNPECWEVFGTSVEIVGLWKFRTGSLKMNYTTASYEPAIPVAVLPARVDVYWETQHRSVWNELECAAEEQELTYEVTWIPELSAWRRFLKSRRNLDR